jgi:hypothetical protein
LDGRELEVKRCVDNPSSELSLDLTDIPRSPSLLSLPSLTGRVHKNDTFLIEPTIHQNMQTLTLGQYDYEHLKIPRKPAWKREMTAEEIDMRERDAFLLWRREIAVSCSLTDSTLSPGSISSQSMENTEADIRATPFEKNIEVWRQLWRVIEKSDIVVQIVDARNPLLY